VPGRNKSLKPNHCEIKENEDFEKEGHFFLSLLVKKKGSYTRKYLFLLPSKG